MLAALKALVIASLLTGGLFCPFQPLMAGGIGHCGDDEAGQTALQASLDMMPCCLDSHRADSPVVQPVSPADVPSASQPSFAPVHDDFSGEPGCFGLRQKYRDKFEERSCGKRE